MDRLISLKEAAQKLGVHPETLRRACGRGEIEYCRAGALIRFRAEALTRWLEACRVVRPVGEEGR